MQRTIYPINTKLTELKFSNCKIIDWSDHRLDFPKILSTFFSRFVCMLERTFLICSALNLPVDFLTGVGLGVYHHSSGYLNYLN